MTYKKLTLLLLFTHLATILLAGDTDSLKLQNRHLTSINTGVSSQISRDEAISPFNYRGKAVPIAIGYQYLGGKSLHLFSSQFSHSELKSDLPDYPMVGLTHHVQSTSFQLRYSYQRKIAAFSEYKTKLFMGGEFSGFLNLRDHFFTTYSSHIMVDYFNSLSINAFLTKEFNDGRQILFLNVSSPVVSYVLLRGTYNAYVGDKIDPLDLGENVLSQLMRSGDFVSVAKLFAIRFDLSYVRYLGDHFGINFKYNFHYYNYSQYDNLLYSRNLYNHYMAGITIRF